MIQDGLTNLSVIYFLTAQLDPREPELFADRDKGISLCRDERVVFIYREHGSSYELGSEHHLTQTLKAKVGGVLGLGSNQTECLISIEKNHFEPNEEI